MAKKSPNQETDLGNRGHLKVLNDTKLFLNVHELPLLSLRINLVSFRTFRHPLFPKPVSWLGLFFATSYSKTAALTFVFKMWQCYFDGCFFRKSVAKFVTFQFKITYHNSKTVLLVLERNLCLQLGGRSRDF